MFQISPSKIWNMIPYLPQDTSELEIPVFYRHIVENLTLRSSHHESWHTHKRDTSVCWICDLVEVANILITELERNISKSALDIDDSFLVQELNSEGATVISEDAVASSDGTGSSS